MMSGEVVLLMRGQILRGLLQDEPASHRLVEITLGTGVPRPQANAHPPETPLGH